MCKLVILSEHEEEKHSRCLDKKCFLKNVYFLSRHRLDIMFNKKHVFRYNMSRCNLLEYIIKVKNRTLEGFFEKSCDGVSKKIFFTPVKSFLM